MSASHAAETEKPFNQPTATPRTFRQRMQIVLSGLLLIAGIALISYGQHLMELRQHGGDRILAAELWNITYRLDIPNYENAYLAIPYLLIGAFLCALTAVPGSWKKNLFPNWAVRGSPQEGAGRQAVSIVIGVFSMLLFLIQLGRHLYMPIYVFLGLISIFVFTRLFWKLDRSAAIDLSPGISSLDLFWITSLLFLGFSITSLALEDIPIAIIPDEDSFWQKAHAIAINQIQPGIFDSGVYTFPIASSIFQSWVLRIFGINLWAWRFSSVIAGVFVVIPLYLLAKEWFGRNLAITTCVLMIANPYFLAFSRLGYNNSQSLFPITLSIYFFALAARKSSHFYLWLSGFTTGLGFYTYTATLIGPIILCFATLYLWFLKDLNWKKALTTLGILFFGWGVAFLPQIAYTLGGHRQDSLLYRIFVASFANVFYGQTYYGKADLVNTMPLIHIGQHTLFYDPMIYSELIFRGAVRTFLVLFDPYVISNHFLVTGLTGVITPVFFLIGLAVSFRFAKQLRFGLPLLWFFGGTILLSVLSAFPPAQTHLVSIIPVLALISAIGLVAVVERFMELLLARQAFLQMLARNTLITIILLGILYLGFQKYFTIMPVTYLPSFEDLPLWIARRLETPIDLIYLGTPQKAYRIKQLLSTSPVSHHYKVTLTNSLSLENNGRNEPTIIFIENQPSQEVPLLQKPPAGFHRPVKYYDSEGQIIGYALTNTETDLMPKVKAEGFRSLTEKPVRYVLGLLTVMLVIFGFFVLRIPLDAQAQKRILP